MNNMNRNENPKFYLSSFQGNITMQMNAAMAIEYYAAIHSIPGVGKELYASTEKIRTQLFHMQMIPTLEKRLQDVSRNVDESSASPRGGLDAGASSGNDLQVAIGGSELVESPGAGALSE